MRDDPEFKAWLEKSCADQGVPLKVTDPATIRKVAVLFSAGSRSAQKRAPGGRRSRSAGSGQT